MARLLYSAIASLDGYIADEEGKFDWAAPDEEVHAFVNDLTRSVGTHLFGRRMYEVMAAWEDPGLVAGQPAAMQDFAALWHAASKVVYSTTLTTVSTAKTRIEQTFDAESIRQMKASATDDISIGGPGLAAHAIAAGLVDEYHVFVTPIAVGGGTHWLPRGVRVPLELLDERRFGGGTVYLRYAARGA